VFMNNRQFRSCLLGLLQREEAVDDRKKRGDYGERQ